MSLRLASFSRAALTVALAGCVVSGRNDAPASSSQALGSMQLGVADATTKIRPSTPLPSATIASIEAARNEFEPFQIVIAGGASGVPAVSATAGALTGPQGATIPATNVRLYQVALYDVMYACNTDGAPGEWPDPLIPDVDLYANEKRNAFPFDVAPNVSRAIWVEVFVPAGTPAGTYTGAVAVSSQGGAAVAVPVTLRVRDFDLPSVPSLKSAFGFSVDSACRAHLGQAYCNSDADAKPFIDVYGRAALAHRISFWNPYYTYPTNNDFTYFDSVTGKLLDGNSATPLAGAHFTTSAIGNAMWSNPTAMMQAQQHFNAKSWSGLFDYTCDEPPMTCAFSDIVTRAQASHSAGVRTLVTTNISNINQYGLADSIDIAVPIINEMQDPSLNDPTKDNRALYDPFLALSKQKEVWSYQSCESQGCGGCDPSNATKSTAAWPSYQIDHPAVRNRAMEWLSYRFDVSGELYWETCYHLDDAWNSYVAGHNALCDFGGNGDGALFYPGTPSKIGGTTDVPVESIRLKMIREGMEDYEYLHLLDSLGGGNYARAQDVALFPAAYQTNATSDALYQTRHRIADQIEQLLGKVPPAVAARAGSTVDVHGDGSVFSAAAPIAVTAGDAGASFRLIWDDAALYVLADVTDPHLAVNATGRDGALWNADGIEVLLDPLVDKSPAPDADDAHVIVTEAGDLLDARGTGSDWDTSATLNVDYAVTMQAGGYRVQLAIPWASLGVTPQAGMKLDGDLALNDVMASGYATGDWAGLTRYAQPALWRSFTLGAPATGGGPQGGDDGGTSSTTAPAPKHGGCSVAPGAAGGSGAPTPLAPLAVLVLFSALLIAARRIT